jgi:hypothetical protein
VAISIAWQSHGSTPGGQTELAWAFGDLPSSLHSIENGSQAKSIFEHTLMSILDCHCA